MRSATVLSAQFVTIVVVVNLLVCASECSLLTTVHIGLVLYIYFLIILLSFILLSSSSVINSTTGGHEPSETHAQLFIVESKFSYTNIDVVCFGASTSSSSSSLFISSSSSSSSKQTHETIDRHTVGQRDKNENEDENDRISNILIMRK